MSTQAPPNIPLIYRLYFTWLDPVISTWGAYMDFFDQDLVLHAGNVAPKRDGDHDYFLRQLGGAMLYYAIIDTFLLRYTKDLVIWTIVQWAALVVDVAILYGWYITLSEQGRTDPAGWRGEDWGCFVITGMAALMRVLFLARIGFGKPAPPVKLS